MVEGELFLGDVLLREGEFQFAPASSDHGELFSDPNPQYPIAEHRKLGA